MSRAGVVLREVGASARSQRVTSLVTVLLILAATATVLVTAGRNAGVQGAVLAQLDAAGTRTLTIRAKGTPPEFTAAVVPQLAAYDLITSVTGFGPVHDVTAAAIPDATRVGMLPAYGTLGARPLADLTPVAGLPQAWATTTATESLGMPAQRGSVRALDGPEYLITGTAELPDHLRDLGPVVIEPRTSTPRDPLSTLVVVAATPQDLPLVSTLVGDALADIPRDDLTVESSQALADLRAVIDGELTRQSRGIVLGVLAGAAGTVLITIWSLVLMRRRDFGRRRALGASRSMILTLIIGQVLILATAGALLGAGLGLALLTRSGQPTPAPDYITAVVAALTLSATLAATAPAAWAARRDPLTELRVP